MRNDGDLHGEAGVSLRQALAEEALSEEDAEVAERHSPVREVIGGEASEPGPDEDTWLERDEVPAAIRRYLKSDEHQVIAVRLHVIRLLWPVVQFGGGLLFAISVNAWWYATSGASPVAVHALWIIWLAGAGWAVHRWLMWRGTWFVITGHRVLMVETTRYLARRVSMLPLGKVRDLRLEETAFGKFAGYGVLDFASIGTEKALDRVAWLPRPDWLYRQICAITMPEEDRRRLSDGRRRGTK